MRDGRRRSGNPLAASALSLCIILAILPATGCGGDGAAPGDDDAGYPGPHSGRAIPLQTLAQGVNSDYGRIADMYVPGDTPPEGLVISDAEEFQRLVSIASFQEPLPEVDFERQIVIAAMQGPKNTGGYAISLTQAFQNGSDIVVEVEVIEPEPDSMTVQVLTSPYHLVLAERSAFDPRGELSFTFIDQDNERISQEFAEV